MLLAFIGMHGLLLLALPFVLPKEWVHAKTLLEVLFFVAFIVLYLEQLLEMLAIFIPVLTGLRQRITGGQNTGGGEVP